MTESHYQNGQRVSDNWDTVFKALSAEPRRQLVGALVDTSPEESVPLPESAMMPNVPLNQNELKTNLYHVHLPMLSEMGFVQWTDDPFTATRGPRFDEVASVITMLQSGATGLPDSLIIGCQRLEKECQGIP